MIFKRSHKSSYFCLLRIRHNLRILNFERCNNCTWDTNSSLTCVARCALCGFLFRSHHWWLIAMVQQNPNSTDNERIATEELEQHRDSVSVCQNAPRQVRRAKIAVFVFLQQKRCVCVWGGGVCVWMWWKSTISDLLKFNDQWKKSEVLHILLHSSHQICCTLQLNCMRGSGECGRGECNYWRFSKFRPTLYLLSRYTPKLCEFDKENTIFWDDEKKTREMILEAKKWNFLIFKFSQLRSEKKLKSATSLLKSGGYGV
jgi:hypothetical protein